MTIELPFLLPERSLRIPVSTNLAAPSQAPRRFRSSPRKASSQGHCRLRTATVSPVQEVLFGRQKGMSRSKDRKIRYSPVLNPHPSADVGSSDRYLVVNRCVGAAAAAVRQERRSSADPEPAIPCLAVSASRRARWRPQGLRPSRGWPRRRWSPRTDGPRPWSRGRSTRNAPQPVIQCPPPPQGAVRSSRW